MKKVEIYTDGACRGNPGRGGWGAVLVYGEHERELSGGEAMTTNNRMELMAAIEALSALKEPCEVTLTSDSKYMVDAVTLGWAKNWKANGWRKSDRSHALNTDLWETLLSLLEHHRVTFVWVKGHDGHPYNERCDRLATEFADTFPPTEEELKRESTEKKSTVKRIGSSKDFDPFCLFALDKPRHIWYSNIGSKTIHKIKKDR
ncbi:MAG: ribonuclease HI [Clostridia bacterium]|nr:ribonuclease HI [Clostridia bacterium]